MIKTIEISQLRIGMYLHALPGNWTSHPFLRNRFLITAEEDIRKITDAGFSRLEIDTEKGADVHVASQDGGGENKAAPTAHGSSVTLAPVTFTETPASLSDELARAKVLISQAERLVRDLAQDVRLGKLVELDRVEPVVEGIVGSILRNPNALLVLLQLKKKDDYTFLHSVGVCALLTAFCRSVGLSAETTYHAGLGGLLHDIGKASIPDEILNKPGRLTEAEFDVIKTHPEAGHAMLARVPGLSPIALDITLRHHERCDGNGYPGALPGPEISELAKMAAIVDVYDAITSERCYHRGMTPANALAKMLEWSKVQLSDEHVRAFIRCIGIFPSGSLVRLASGRLGVVVEQNSENLLKPTVNVFFNVKSNTYIKPERIDLASSGAAEHERIMCAENPQRWKVEPHRFVEVGQMT
ncbi:HD-GYP domain-containing protein [Noviherbaspirillum pedocola]|uniref:HD-GYP domain-containing protein n=1 Tax=Noviherbaspirillum pedocola TaxID=2801341 RepID=A0A934SYK2_9BURK|nr:HD-GYP domain-containing protein [Noviherbaspirillum pedocola]MBK4739231.1 HD-GYP domain-containing protein [Noviherbaspirillum pedocola]